MPQHLDHHLQRTNGGGDADDYDPSGIFGDDVSSYAELGLARVPCLARKNWTALRSVQFNG